MQGSGLIKFLLVLLVIICVMQCSYILPTRKVEKAADEYAAMVAERAPSTADKYELRKEARTSYLDSISSETIFSIPKIKDYTYDELKNQQLALGLDLKGGQSAVLQVDLKELLVSLSNNSKDPTFLQALENADQALLNSQSDYISLFGSEFRKIADGKKLARFFYRKLSDDTNGINTQSSDTEVLNVLRTKSNETVNLTFNLLKQRIDKLGVVQPNISLDAARDLILVELPGVDNEERARQQLQSSAILEFWDTYRINEVASAFTQADQRLKAGAEPIAAPAKETIWVPEYDGDGNIIDSTQQEVDIVDDTFQNQGPLLSKLALNTAGGFSAAVMGVAPKNQRNAISEMLNSEEIKGLFPKDGKLVWAQKPNRDIDGIVQDQYSLYMVKQTADGKSRLEGDQITSAGQGPDPTSGEIKVNLGMNQQGAKIWADMTTKAAQNGNREVAITLDDEVITAPRVNEAITGGRTEISGNFTVQEASDLSNMLEIGKLPAKVKIIQSASVGPSLGQENINKSMMSFIIGIGLVLLFMVLYYGGAGIVSIIALVANMFFIFAALASFGTVLTLPGIAGILLTIGMAVDANVIIYERVREELRAGKSLLASIQDGFKNSYSAIIDANVTTFFVAAILAYFGLGPIKGFAVVLMIGVVSSVFTAVLLTLMMMNWWTKKKEKNLTFWTGWSKNAFANLNIDWIGKRKIAYVISGVFITAGLISIFTRGFDLGVDFKGGYSYNIQFAEDVNVDREAISQALTDSNIQSTVKAVDTRNTYNIVTSYLIDDKAEDAPDRVMEAVFGAINSISGGNLDFEKFKASDAQGVTHITASSQVGPTIADDIKKSSRMAGVFALILIFLYIFIRFNKWQYSLGAVAALLHDTLFVLGAFSLLHGILPISMEIDQAFIAALLTVIGYSINDTVVVFDRIREYLGIYTNKNTDDIINMAVNSTFSRTVITSLTTLFMVAVLLVFGGGSIKGFALALVIGILVGTYSSVFVATPILRDFSDELKPKSTKSTKKSFSRAAKANV
jgi:SecD/SecF fusion protein